MDEVLHANIFFFITGIAVIIFTALLCVALFHFIKLLRTLRRIMDRVEEGTEVIAEDMQNLREYIMEDGFFARLMRTFMGGGKSSARGRGGKQERKRTELKINGD